MSEKTSEILLGKYLSRDPDAASSIFERYAERVSTLARSRLNRRMRSKADADDIVQETFIAFFALADQKKVDWQKEGDLGRLLAGIAINQTLRTAEFYSAQKRDIGREIQAGSAFEESQSEPDDRAAGDLLELLQVQLRKEKSLTVRIVVSRLAGNSQDEIARQTGRSVRTIRRILTSFAEKVSSCSGMESEGIVADTYVDEVLTADYGNYEILRMVGAGGFGKIYVARDIRTDRKVAMKVLRKSRIDNVTARRGFLNEAAALANVNHPNVVRFFETGLLPNGSYFTILEHLHGTTLAKTELEELEVSDVFNIIKQIAAGLAYLHGNEIVHGDLKPANVVVTGKRVRIIDFGLSLFRPAANSAAVAGTRGFLSPELEVSAAADVFSFGRLVQFIRQAFHEALPEQVNAIAEEALNHDKTMRPASTRILELLNDTDAC